MPPSTENPPLTSGLRQFGLFAAAMLFIAGGGLFFVAEAARADWPWTIGTYDAHFLGAVLLAAFTAAFLLGYYGRWAPARLVLPMLFVLTGGLLVASLFEPRRFDFRQATTWLWFGLDGLFFFTTAYYLWRYRGVPALEIYPTPLGWRNALLILALVLGLYGGLMFLFPTVFTAFWPWPVDAFHGRLYSAIFTTAAAGAVGLSQWAAPVERLTLGAVYSVLGLFALFGVIIAGAVAPGVAWTSPGVWLWLALFGLLFLAGLALIWWSSSAREGA